jgi:hypothetical protein
MDEYEQSNRSTERTTTADLAGMTPEQTDGRNGNGAGGDGHVAAAQGATATAEEDAARTPLLPQSESEALHQRWTDVQAQFVDDPHRAVQDADALVAELMQRLAKMFADERGNLEKQWSAGGEVSTEDLRMALRRYRSFFERLLSV